MQVSTAGSEYQKAFDSGYEVLQLTKSRAHLASVQMAAAPTATASSANRKSATTVMVSSRGAGQ